MLSYSNVLQSSVSVIEAIQYQPIVVRPEAEEDVYDNFEKSLYRNSKVCRIVLGEQFKQQTKINFDQWYTVSLKFVTEIGLPALGATSSVTCQLLDQKEQGYFSESTRLSIQYRHHVDPWKSNSGAFDLQYRIISVTKEDATAAGEFYIRIFAQNEKFLSLCVGPFEQQEQHQQSTITSMSSIIGWEENNDRYQMYRAIPIADENKYSLLQEVWENGTPGKLWDSAIVMNTILKKLFEANKDFLSGKRIMDLSAGIGSVGLAIAQSCEIFQVSNPPSIIMTDLEEALPLMKSNQKLNSIHNNANNLSIETMPWGSKKYIDMVLSRGSFDYIFASDVLYNTRDFPVLINTLCQITFQNTHITVYLGYKPRGLTKSEENQFFNGCKVYFNIKLLTLNSFVQELDQKHLCHFASNILEETGVCLYKITRK